jgi:hypothetical protein
MSRPSKKRLRASASDKRRAKARTVGERTAQELLDNLDDFVLIICDECGLEQSAHESGCVVCGCKTGTTSPNHEATVAAARERANLLKETA